MTADLPGPRRRTLSRRLVGLLPTRLPVRLPTRLPVRLPTKLPIGLPTKLPIGLPTRLRTADEAALLDRLPPLEYRPGADEDQLFEQAALSRVLLLMARVDQEAEYLLCRQLAEHALGSVPGPGPDSGPVSGPGTSPE